jgi:hypothetical protein
VTFVDVLCKVGRLEPIVAIVVAMCVSLTNPSKYSTSLGMVSIVSMGVMDIFTLMKWVNIFDLSIDIFSSPMVFSLLHHASSLVGLNFFVYPIVASTGTRRLGTVMCENNS